MVKKKKIKNKITPDKIHPSIKYGIPLYSLKLLAGVNVILVLIGYFDLERTGIAYPFVIILVPSIITLISLLFSFFDNLLEKYQILTYVLIFLNTLIAALEFVYGSLEMCIGAGPENFTFTRYRSYLTPVAILFSISIISFVIYHQKKIVLKLNKGKALSYPLSLGAIVSATILGRHTSSSLSDTIIGIGGVVIGAGILPGVAVGALFCIIDLIKHPELKNNYE